MPWAGFVKPTINKMEKQLIINAISSLTGLFSVLTGAGKTEEASEVSKKILELVNQL
jgi:late competence protein required for DNA uptake (superfamily II DNA/RNA helicase)